MSDDNPLSLEHPLHDDRVPEADLREKHWFDGDSEGPFSLTEVEQEIARRPGTAHEFHVTDHPELNHPVLLPRRHTSIVEGRRIC